MTHDDMADYFARLRAAQAAAAQRPAQAAVAGPPPPAPAPAPLLYLLNLLTMVRKGSNNFNLN